MLATNMQGRKRFTVREAGSSYTLRPGDVDRIVDAMSQDTCRAYHVAAQSGDTAMARTIFMNAATTFYSSAPAAPAVAVARPQQRSQRRTSTLIYV